MDTSNPKKSTLPAKVIYGYALGEFGFTFFLVYIAYYLMYFLTDVLAFGTAVSAIIFTICQWSEAISVLFSGAVIDRLKIGYRKWMLSGALICWVFTTLMFIKFLIPNTFYVYLFALLYMIAYWGYNLMWVSYRSLLGILSRSSYDTVVLSTTGAQLGTVASVLFSILGVRLLSTYAATPSIYGISGFLYSSTLLLGIVVVFTISKPYDKINSIKKESAAKLTLEETKKVLKGPMMPLVLSIAFRSSVSVILSALLIYYLRYVVNDIAIMARYVTVLSVASFLGAYSARKIAKYVDKRHIYLWSGLINVFLLILVFFVGTSSTAFLIIMSINFYFTFLGNVLIPVFFNDVCDYNLHVNKIDARGTTFSLGSLSLNASQILGSGIAAFGLVIINYDAKLAITPAIITGIRYLMSIVPAFVLTLGLAAFMFYKLKDETMDKIHQSMHSMEIEDKNEIAKEV